MKKEIILPIVSVLLVALSFTICLISLDKRELPRDTLVIGCDVFSNKFSPFFSETANDQEVWALTSVSLFASDRNGNIIDDGINGTIANYNGIDYLYYGLGSVNTTVNNDGTVDYDITIRCDEKTVFFSDGWPITIDDVIFSMYVLADPSYDGSSTFYTLPIEGMKEYRESYDVSSISGIIRTGDSSLRIHMSEFSAVSIYQLNVAVAPLHYYGDKNLYDYPMSFGFVKGDLSVVRKKTTSPMGAGPYIFLGYSGGIISYERNENYWEGIPKIKYIKLKEYRSDADKMPALNNGDIDIASPSISQDLIDLIKKTNGNNELSGDKVTTSLVDYNGYGYIGICADVVNVGGNKSSSASKNLRKAFATVFAVYREYTLNSYFGECATVINYPISNCSWASPRPHEQNYNVAYSKDINGNTIYSANMQEQQKWDIAKNTAIEYLIGAGYVYDGNKFTKAPDGSSLTYSFLIPAGGTGDHPTLALANKASEVFRSIGIELIVKDIANPNELWDGLSAGTVAFWAAAWGGSNDPDMYQIYHSSNSTGSNHYRIQNDRLDMLIVNARKRSDKLYRKSLYSKALDIILDEAVEVPVYQRKSCTLFANERVNTQTITPDITSFWTYMSEIHKLEMA